MQTSRDGGVDDYDLLPYPSMPYPDTQPSRLAALMALHGLEAPCVDRARTLELGAASGGNIIPLAARFPEARFVGIDLARRHIDEGRARISQLGLTNIELRHGDLTDASFGVGAFDYVICHGVFSWVPRMAQEAIFNLCRESLSSTGVAVISYNVLPGWRLRQVIRDICLQHAGTEGTPKERVARVRAILDDLAASSDKSDPYGLLLRNEAQRIAHRPASYILGEFLVADNTPCFFSDFIDRALQHGLEYVCEGDLDASTPNVANPGVQARLAAHAGPSPISAEQYADYFTGRTFRCSLLRRAGASGAPQRQFERLKSLHLSADLRRHKQEGGAPPVLKDGRGRIVPVSDAGVARALNRLADGYPSSLTWDELRSPGDAAADARLEAALGAMVRVGQAIVSTLPFRTGHAAARHPRMWPLARIEAAAGQPWLTGRHHVSVAVKPLVGILAPLLDGNHDHEQLVDQLAGALSARRVRVPELEMDNLLSDPAQVRRVAIIYCDRILRYLARNGLLEPDGDPAN